MVGDLRQRPFVVAEFENRLVVFAGQRGRCRGHFYPGLHDASIIHETNDDLLEFNGPPSPPKSRHTMNGTKSQLSGHQNCSQIHELLFRSLFSSSVEARECVALNLSLGSK